MAQLRQPGATENDAGRSGLPGRHGTRLADELSAKLLTMTDPKTGQAMIPHVIEPSVGLNRLLLVALCDAYCAMTTDRPYRTSNSHADTIRIMRDESTGAFNVELFKRFEEIISGRATAEGPS